MSLSCTGVCLCSYVGPFRANIGFFQVDTTRGLRDNYNLRQPSHTHTNFSRVHTSAANTQTRTHKYTERNNENEQTHSFTGNREQARAAHTHAHSHTHIHTPTMHTSWQLRRKAVVEEVKLKCVKNACGALYLQRNGWA